jgi:hypothetical protein
MLTAFVAPTSRPRLQPARTAILVAVAGFVWLELAAMHAYPGGTWWDRTTRGARFWQNYLCDLEWRVALDGEPNPVGSRLAQAAMLLLVAGFVPFWWVLPRLFTGARAGPGTRALGRAVRGLGIAGVAGMAAVSLLPSDRFGALHGVAVIVAGVPALSAALLAAFGLLRGEPRPRVAGLLGASTLAFAMLDFLLYARTLSLGALGGLGGPGPMLLPAIQKVAVLLLLAWMAAVAVRAPPR